MREITPGRRILILEDDPIIALDLAENLREEGFEIVGPAATVAEAMELINETSIDGASLDFELGLETSVPVAQRLMAENVPVVIVSGRAESIDRSLFPIPVKTLSKPANAKQIIAALFRA